ncbi:GIY-YIG nuclease family protein [Zafaria sp. J156]|uniref:GIY-YIG nuclease family protein n=1 Tax=Zafaria sp. J156 TaxID=3116490 RepID=UPI002E79E706|nr:GIY-YIG nuclease family protein [Zafaria sp. J156]MEE1623005.1 GIY-YIG nuclease family protein [Zafaria sp. J156]
MGTATSFQTHPAGKPDQMSPTRAAVPLFHDQNPVYVGKADKSLRQRLLKHYKKLSGRKSKSHESLLDRIHFKCLYVMEDLNALAPVLAAMKNCP